MLSSLEEGGTSSALPNGWHWVYLHSYNIELYISLLCIRIPLEPHFMHTLGILLLYLLSSTVHVRYLYCIILSLHFIDTWVWVLTQALSKSCCPRDNHRSSFQDIPQSLCCSVNKDVIKISNNALFSWFYHDYFQRFSSCSHLC